MKEVATRAGVSPMTASYTFSKPGRVAPATRELVREAAAELGYRPDAVGRALRSGRTQQLGVVFGEHLSYAFDDPQAAQFLAGVAEVCVAEVFGVTLIPTRGDTSDVDRVLSAAVDGYVLWTTAEDDPVLDAVGGDPRPAAIQGGPRRDGIACVTQDDYQAAFAVASQALGEDRAPVVLSFPADRSRRSAVATGADLPADVLFPVTAARLRGYRDAIEASGRTWAETPVAVAPRNTRGEGAAAARRLAPGLPANTLVIAMSDELALGAYEALHATHPDTAYTGWDGSRPALELGMWSVTNPLREQGRRCARIVVGGDGGGDADATAGRFVPWSVRRGPLPREHR
ncbi:LacI family transcriptional regulator [Marinitenerispora sediminis]|uniref:LacI family transcriptional regulator n=1 Tax=Marinitenerispora sediminis TaxID=1931232 RepID=A0A368T4G8_9ACTN|nr:LacI family transcriptional regulator [Marinitenerispora sediminis]RCV58316.1 LacI family transcriptional regulator [Marinitenerispora sediminis]RCV59688.1 LacI family transcriptional regulator [Marinitenerispora sediminis]